MLRIILLSLLFATLPLLGDAYKSLHSQIVKKANQQIAKGNIKLAKLQTYDNAHKGTFSPNGKLLALLGRGYADIIEIASNRRLIRIAPGNAVILGVKFSPDGRLLATAYRFSENINRAEFKVTMWDVSSGKEKLNLPVAEDEWQRVVDDLSFSSDGLLLASNLGGIARLWNVADGTEARRFPPPADNKNLQSERVLLSPNGQRLAVYFKSDEPSVELVRVWNLSNEKQTELQTNVYLDWAFSPNSNLLILTAIKNKGRSDEHSAAEIWDTGSGLQKIVIEVPSQWRGAYAVAFSPDDSAVAIGGYKRFGIFSAQTGDLLLEEQHARSRFFEDNEQIYQLSDVEFSPDRKILLTGNNGGTIKLWQFDK